MTTFLDLLKKNAWRQKFLDVKHPVHIRQSKISAYDFCQFKSNAESKVREGTVKPLYFLLGTVLHDIIWCLHNDMEVRTDVIVATAVAKQSYDWSETQHNGDIAKCIEWFSNRCWDKSVYYGMSLVDLARMMYNYIRFVGIKLVACELELKLVIGKVKITGQVDLLGADGTIIDTKSGGLYKKFIGTGSLAKQSYDEEQVLFSTQHQMYDWLIYRTLCRKANRYAFALPVNLIPNVSGANKGKSRGNPLVSAPAVTLEQLISEYEKNLLEVTKAISYSEQHNVFRKTYPKDFGKLYCPRCDVKGMCLGKTVPNFTGNLPKYLQDK